MLLRSKLDRVYEDRLSDVISDDVWTTKAAELQEELEASASRDGASRGREPGLRGWKQSHRTPRSIADVFRRATFSRSMCSRMRAKLEIGSPHWTISATGSSAKLH